MKFFYELALKLPGPFSSGFLSVCSSSGFFVCFRGGVVSCVDIVKYICYYKYWISLQVLVSLSRVTDGDFEQIGELNFISWDKERIMISLSILKISIYNVI